jgi:hypothetical protein
MKIHFVLLQAVLWIAWSPVGVAQTLDWGDRVFAGEPEGTDLTPGSRLVFASSAAMDDFFPDDLRRPLFDPDSNGFVGFQWLRNRQIPAEDSGWPEPSRTPLPFRSEIPTGILATEPGFMLSYSVVPETSSTVLLALAGGIFLSFRRRNGGFGIIAR